VSPTTQATLDAFKSGDDVPREIGAQLLNLDDNVARGVVVDVPTGRFAFERRLDLQSTAGARSWVKTTWRPRSSSRPILITSKLSAREDCLMSAWCAACCSLHVKLGHISGGEAGENVVEDECKLAKTLQPASKLA